MGIYLSYNARCYFHMNRHRLKCRGDRNCPNINFFMNVPVTSDGHLKFDDGISAPGKYVEIKAEMDLIVLISNCPQLNNPCNAYNPTKIQLIIREGEE